MYIRTNSRSHPSLISSIHSHAARLLPFFSAVPPVYQVHPPIQTSFIKQIPAVNTKSKSSQFDNASLTSYPPKLESKNPKYTRMAKSACPSVCLERRDGNSDSLTVRV